jgi:hypothetical protein
MASRIGHLDGGLVRHRQLAGRGLVGRQPGPEALRRRIQRGLQRDLPRDVALLPPLGPQRVGHVAGQDRPQPFRTRRVVVAPKLVALSVRLKQRLLHDIRRIERAVRSRPQLQTRQDVQIIAESFEAWRIREIRQLHDTAPPSRHRSRSLAKMIDNDRSIIAIARERFKTMRSNGLIERPSAESRGRLER